jgi:hypothetical protein
MRGLPIRQIKRKYEWPFLCFCFPPSLLYILCSAKIQLSFYLSNRQPFPLYVSFHFCLIALSVFHLFVTRYGRTISLDFFIFSPLGLKAKRSWKHLQTSHNNFPVNTLNPKDMRHQKNFEEKETIFCLSKAYIPIVTKKLVDLINVIGINIIKTT